MIAYPVRASGDGTERIIDAAGHVLGTVEIVEEWNAMHHMLNATDVRSVKNDALPREMDI